MAVVILDDILPHESEMGILAAGLLFVILALAFLNLSFARRSHFDELVEVEELKRPHKDKRDTRK